MSVAKSGANLMQFGSNQIDTTDKNQSYRSEIDSSDSIFMAIKEVFESHISDYKISRIYKNNNGYLLKFYESHLDIISQCNNTLKSENERFLWHGTDKKCVEPILNKGYNRNYGIEMVHGIGTYFAVSPHDSMAYTSADTFGVRYLTYNRCIVGKSCIGYDGDKEPSDPRCDSMTDNVLNPQQFCIPSDYNVYPCYLIEVVEAQKITKKGNKKEQQQRYEQMAQKMLASTSNINNNNNNKSMDDNKNKKKRDRSGGDDIHGIDDMNELKQPPQKKQKISHPKQSEISKEEKRKRKQLLIKEKLKLSSKKDGRDSFDDKAPSNNVPIENTHFTVKEFEEYPGYKLFVCSRCDKVVDSYHTIAKHVRCRHFTSKSVAESKSISGEWYIWEHSELNTERFKCILCCSPSSPSSTSQEKTWSTSRGVMFHAKDKHNKEWCNLD